MKMPLEHATEQQRKAIAEAMAIVLSLPSSPTENWQRYWAERFMEAAGHPLPKPQPTKEIAKP